MERRKRKSQLERLFGAYICCHSGDGKLVKIGKANWVERD